MFVLSCFLVVWWVFSLSLSLSWSWSWSLWLSLFGIVVVVFFFRGFSGMLLISFDASEHFWAALWDPLGSRVRLLESIGLALGGPCVSLGAPWGSLSGVRNRSGSWGGLGGGLGAPRAPPKAPGASLGGLGGALWKTLGGAPGRPREDPEAASEATFGKRAALGNHSFYFIK